MSFPTVYYITQVIPSCYSAGYAMCVCVSFGACVYRSLDTTFHCYIDSVQTSSTMINDELKQIRRWLASNKLSLNVRKTKYIILYGQMTY